MGPADGRAARCRYRRRNPLDAAYRARQLIGEAVAEPPAARTVRAAPPVQVPAERPGVALLICGPTAVGKSTIGFALFLHLLTLGRASAYLDLQQLGFLRDVPLDNPGGYDADRHQLTATCVADLWHEYQQAGARNLVLTGHVQHPQDVDRYRQALGDTPLLVCRLRATSAHLRERVQARTGGTGPELAGDDLIGLSGPEVEAVLKLALAEQEHLDALETTDLVFDTDGIAPEVIARRLAKDLVPA